MTDTAVNPHTGEKRTDEADVVERLRAFYGPDTDNWLDADEAEPLMLEAADEIELLREMLRVEGEITRLRRERDQRDGAEP